jgi:hypothetical protein
MAVPPCVYRRMNAAEVRIVPCCSGAGQSVDGVPKGSHWGKGTADGVDQKGYAATRLRPTHVTHDDDNLRAAGTPTSAASE